MGRPSGPTRDTKRLICERALEVFAEKGYAATTMRDVAATVGMRDASLYSHYPSKQAIFDAAVEHQLDRLTQALRSQHALAHPTDDPSAYLTEGPELAEVVLASYEPLFADARHHAPAPRARGRAALGPPLRRALPHRVHRAAARAAARRSSRASSTPGSSPPAT